MKAIKRNFAGMYYFENDHYKSEPKASRIEVERDLTALANRHKIVFHRNGEVSFFSVDTCNFERKISGHISESEQAPFPVKVRQRMYHHGCNFEL